MRNTVHLSTRSSQRALELSFGKYADNKSIDNIKQAGLDREHNHLKKLWSLGKGGNDVLRKKVQGLQHRQEMQLNLC